MKNKSLRVILSILSCLLIAIIAIIMHIIVPTPKGEENAFDSVFVKLFSFPVVATFYFVILSNYIYIVILIISKRTNYSWKKIGFYVGISFGLIYLVAMQEVVVSQSPFSTYGKDFIIYELLIGLGDALPTFAISFLLAYINKNNNNNSMVKKTTKNEIFFASFIAIVFIVGRIILYYTNAIGSDIKLFPIPTIIWTIIFGITLGVSYLFLSKVFTSNNRYSVIIIIGLLIGLNWIWFNLFIGLVFKGLFFEMLLRGSVDILIVSISLFIFIYVKNRFNKIKN